ncbi:MAG TPA: aminotransferase class IV [Pyrinomonadaceae bacterium]|jgi:branched-subunit amino acid aminotransferase/4-amino-4-deoxychorismate lyase
MRIIHNQRLLDAASARLPALTAATLCGRGVFTNVAVHGGRAFLWAEHWARLVAHAERAGVAHAEFDEETVGDSLARLLAANNVERGLARVTLLARAATELDGMAAASGRTSATDLLIMTGELTALTPDEGLAITLSPARVNTHAALTGVKTTSYLEHVLAQEEARARGFDEAVRLNERGEIVSATTANIFWVTKGTAHTPALSTGALAGTTRACVLALAAELALPVVEGVYELAQLGDADEIFLTSARFGVGLVTTYDFHRYTVPAGSVALRLREALRQLQLQAPEADE